MPSRKHRTEAEVREVFIEWVVKLELLHWHFDLRLDEDLTSDEERDAEISISKDYNRALIRLDKPGWKHKWSDETLVRNIVHELIHCHLERFLEAATVVEDTLPETAKELYESRVGHELEAATDAIAALIVRSFGGVKDGKTDSADTCSTHV